LRAADQAFGADRAEIVYAFADGWTVRRLTSTNDERREGTLMRNCMRSGRTVHPRGRAWYSLRDTDNFPRSSISHDPDRPREKSTYAWPAGGGPVFGMRSPKPQYMERIREWLDSLPYPAHLDEPRGFAWWVRSETRDEHTTNTAPDRAHDERSHATWRSQTSSSRTNTS
jgi:hypothetical protein